MILFGPSGNSESFYAEGYSHTEQSAKFVKERGLDCFEYSFGRGVRMTEAKAISIGAAFREQGVEISVHAPYYINFANPDDESARKSYNYVLESGKMLKLMGGKRCVFHSATQGKMEREDAVALTEERLKADDRTFRRWLDETVGEEKTAQSAKKIQDFLTEKAAEKLSEITGAFKTAHF